MLGPSWKDIPIELQARLAAGDPAALGTLAAWLDAHPPQFVSEDVRQKVLATLCRLVHTERGRSVLHQVKSVPGLLATIARRHRDEERRTAARLADVIASLAARRFAGCNEFDPPKILVRSEVRAAIAAGFGSLTPLERDVLGRFLVLRQGYREIADALFGTAHHPREETRLRKLASRARRKLQERLKIVRAP